MRNHLILILLVLSTNVASAAIDTAVATGNWGSASTWSPSIPSDGDTIYIPGGVTVTVDADQGVYANMTLAVQGVLYLAKNDHLEMDSNSIVYIGTGGNVGANNGNSKLIIGGTTVHKGTSPTNPLIGPIPCNVNGCGFTTGSPTAIYQQWLLPIELLFFKATAKADLVELNWATASETNNDYFVVEKLSSMGQWQEISMINGAGTSSRRNDYTAFDNGPFFNSQEYYRLKQVDFDGSEELFNVESVDLARHQEPLKPFVIADKKELFLPAAQSSYFVQALDIEGKILFEKHYESDGQSRRILLSDLPVNSGLLILAVQSNSQEITHLKVHLTNN